MSSLRNAGRAGISASQGFLSAYLQGMQMAKEQVRYNKELAFRKESALKDDNYRGRMIAMAEDRQKFSMLTGAARHARESTLFDQKTELTGLQIDDYKRRRGIVDRGMEAGVKGKEIGNEQSELALSTGKLIQPSVVAGANLDADLKRENLGFVKESNPLRLDAMGLANENTGDVIDHRRAAFESGEDQRGIVNEQNNRRLTVAELDAKYQRGLSTYNAITKRNTSNLELAKFQRSLSNDKIDNAIKRSNLTAKNVANSEVSQSWIDSSQLKTTALLNKAHSPKVGPNIKRQSYLETYDAMANDYLRSGGGAAKGAKSIDEIEPEIQDMIKAQIESWSIKQSQKDRAWLQPDSMDRHEIPEPLFTYNNPENSPGMQKLRVSIDVMSSAAGVSDSERNAMHTVFQEIMGGEAQLAVSSGRYQGNVYEYSMNRMLDEVSEYMTPKQISAIKNEFRNSKWFKHKSFEDPRWLDKGKELYDKRTAPGSGGKF